MPTRGEIESMHIFRTIAAAVLAATLLVGCSPQAPFTESFKKAIPAALLASDLGITEASADNDVDGLAVNLDVVAVFDRGSVSQDDLTELLGLVVKHNNLTHPHDLRIFGFDGTTPEPREYLALASVGDELGFAPETDSPGYFKADWADVVAFVKAHPQEN